MIRIAFVGKRAAGQTQAAIHLKTKHGFKRTPLRDGVYKTLWRLYEYKHYYHIPPEVEWKYYDAMYGVDHKVFVTYLKNRLTRITNDVVVEDVRYTDEVEYLKNELGFLIVRIVAPEEHRKMYIPKMTRLDGSVLLYETFNHDPSAAIRANYVIANNSREELKAGLDKMIGDIKK